MDTADCVKSTLSGSGADIFSIGKSAAGEDVLCAHRGDYSGGQIIITAAIHARECCTAHVVLKQIQEYEGNGGVYFIPLVNPDGARFFEGRDIPGFPVLGRNEKNRLIWKANAEGVDLNVNFDANWGSGRQNVLTPGPSDFIGAYPLCAPESRFLAAFTERVMPIFTLSYHCMGGELYWEYGQSGNRLRRDRKIAAAIATEIGVKKVDGHLFSAGGFKDYCIQKMKIPSVTVELIKTGSHPFYEKDIADDIEKNVRLPEFITRLMRTI